MKQSDSKTNEKEMVKGDEISLIDLVKTLLKDRRLFIRIVIIFIFIGLLVALFSKKEYEASTIMVPQMDNQTSRLGGLSSLASLAGFNLDMNLGSDAISPMLYPEIISSVSFQLEIMNAEYLFEESEEPISLLDYYINVYKPGLFGILKKYTVGLPGLILTNMKKGKEDEASNSKPEIIKLTRDQYEVSKKIKENLNLRINEKEGYLTLVSRFHQPFLAAQIAQKSQEFLQKYVTQFKVEKATAQLEFIQGRYDVSKSEFEEAQSRLAAFRDANKNISSEIMRTQEERLQNEYQLAFDVYSELAKQLEQALIKVEENTPVFSVINEVVVPIEKSKPKRTLILVIWFFLGIITGSSVIFGKAFFKNLKTKWQALYRE